MYERQQAEWAREEAARQRLLEEVMRERELQLQERMERIHEQQEESTRARQQLLDLMAATKRVRNGRGGKKRGGGGEPHLSQTASWFV